MPTQSKGFFLIEVIVASAVIAVVLVLLLGSIQNSVGVSKRSLERTQASYLIEEGAEAVKTIRDRGWTNISTLTDGTYYLSWSGTQWSLGATPESIDRFTRSVTIASVSRDSSDDITTSGGSNDTGTKKITVQVSWPSPGGVQAENISLFISDITR